MTEETKTNPVVMAGDLITRPGLYEARCGHIVPISGWDNGWWVSECDGVVDWFSSDGLQRCRANTDVGQWDLVRWVAPLPASEAEPETTSEQLAEIEGQATEYTPPEGWRVVRFGEQLLPGDVWVSHDGTEQRSNILQWDASAVSGGRCIRRIGPEPQPQPQPQPHTAAIEELRSEVSYVQNLLGTERRRVTQLEELVTSLRTIIRGCENAVRDAGKENTALRNQLEAVKAELVTQSETSRRLQIELDAAQQVPADSPELRQLRADLAEVTQERDTYRHAHELLVKDANTVHERTKAMTVEAIAEWLEPVRLVDSPNLANETLQHLPQIMRSLVGLDSPEDVD